MISQSHAIEAQLVERLSNFLTSVEAVEQRALQVLSAVVAGRWEIMQTLEFITGIQEQTPVEDFSPLVDHGRNSCITTKAT